MSKIFIAIPCVDKNEDFEASLTTFLSEIEGSYDVEVHRCIGKKRDEARNELVDKFLESDKNFILFLDNDHTGHTKAMLDDLSEKKASVCSIKCYARYFPYQCVLSTDDDKFNDRYSTTEVNTERGYSKCRFIGFGMVLISKDVFYSICRPFFKCDERGEKEDNYFGDKVKAAGFSLIGCFNHTLTHQGIDESNLLTKRKSGILIDFRKREKRKVIRNLNKGIQEKRFKVNPEMAEYVEAMDLISQL